MKLIEVKTVDKKLLKEIVEKILSVVTPVQIVLFGSYAYGVPTKDSDLDIYCS